LFNCLKKSFIDAAAKNPNNIHALPGTTNHERTDQHIVLSYKVNNFE